MTTACRIVSIACLASIFVSPEAAAQVPIRSAHIVFTAPRSAGSERLLEELERAYLHVRAWGLRLPSRVAVWGYSTSASYVRGSRAPSATLAATVRESIHLQPVDILLRQGALTRTLRHEMAHVALDGAARHGLPRWFNEGLAMLVAGERQIETVRFRSLGALEHGLGSKNDHAKTRSAYETARRLLSRLEEEHGRARIATLAHAVSHGGGVPDRFRELTGCWPDVWAAGRLAR